MSNPAASADEETEHSDEQEETYQPIRLHATTSRFDDWLHRGPWLHSLPYFVYMHNIRRVRKVKASQASKQASQRFEFDKHYPLSDLYQQEMDKGVIPRLVGTQCKEDESNQREDYAIWHLALFGPAKCRRSSTCSRQRNRSAPQRRRCHRWHTATSRRGAPDSKNSSATVSKVTLKSRPRRGYRQSSTRPW